MFKVKTVLTSKYTPTGLAKKYGTTYQAVVGELNKGIRVEGEHTGNKLVAKKLPWITWRRICTTIPSSKRLSANSKSNYQRIYQA